MKALKISTFCLFLICQLVGVQAQTVSGVFLELPQRFLPELSMETKRDLIEFYRNGNLAVMPSVFGGKVTLEKLSADYLKIKTSERSHVQLKLLRDTDSTECLALVQTATGVLNDSRVQFLDLQYKPLNSIKLPKILREEFLMGSGISLHEKDQYVQMLPNRLALEFIFQPDSDTLMVKSSLKSDLSLEFKNKMEPMIQDSILFKFINGAFKRI